MNRPPADRRTRPQTFLAEAEGLLRDGDGLPGVWPRACVWLTRLALEAALDDLWAARLPQARGISMRAQLLLLPDHLDADTTDQARRAWLGLSRAAHHHRVELAPTVTEIRRWHAEVGAVAAAVSRRTATALPVS